MSTQETHEKDVGLGGKVFVVGNVTVEAGIEASF